mmetsp:Transcript_8516/g.12605  ORF Transcript_8516/g.12605 Transcript_8516/m.12605 type:complete len:87 (-) Transcript_8516:575-835(-)
MTMVHMYASIKVSVRKFDQRKIVQTRKDFMVLNCNAILFVAIAQPPKVHYLPNRQQFEQHLQQQYQQLQRQQRFQLPSPKRMALAR